MMDKSIPYESIVMRLPCGAPTPPPVRVTPGYSLRMFRAGDETAWAEIETSVDEFDNTAQAMEYFNGEYRPYYSVLDKRMVFALAPDGTPVATSTAWFFEDKNQYMHGGIHWVACSPAHQRRGLGRAVVTRCIELGRELNPGRDIFLHTQTWSHNAVELYLSLGFRPCRNDVLAHGGNDYEKAVPILRGVMSREAFERFVETTD